MNTKQQRLADKCASLEPLDGRVLICADKVRTYKSTGLTSKPVDPSVSDDAIIEGETEMMVEEIETDANYRYQTGVVLQVPRDEVRFGVGSTVVFDLGALQNFDYIRGVSILKRYDVVVVNAAASKEVVTVKV